MDNVTTFELGATEEFRDMAINSLTHSVLTQRMNINMD